MTEEMKRQGLAVAHVLDEIVEAILANLPGDSEVSIVIRIPKSSGETSIAHFSTTENPQGIRQMIQQIQESVLPFADQARRGEVHLMSQDGVLEVIRKDGDVGEAFDA